MEQAKAGEKDMQADYERSMSDAAAKREADAKAASAKEGMKAGTEAQLHKLNQESKAKKEASIALAEYTANLHSECDWLLANFDTRKEARAGEVEALYSAT